MFDNLTMAPPDSILGLTEAFNKDPNPAKINLAVGVYKDAQGKTPVLAAVKAAEAKILATEASKNYVPIDGTPAYAQAVRELLFGPAHEVAQSKRSATAHTPGGTAALRVAADYLRKMHGAPAIWMSDPTWPNHPQVFEAAGLKVKTYPYFDAAGNTLAFDKMIAAMQQVPAGDVVLLHACCHNPTGIDPTLAQWQTIAQTLSARQALPLVDFAYQGLGDGMREDALCLGALCQPGSELLICSSFSKNFGLYNERVGALTAVGRSEAAAQAVLSHLKAVIRCNYSNPPAHGGAIVTTVLSDAALRRQWEEELTKMRQRINGMRRLFAETLQKKGVQRDFSFITKQRGMFSYSGLTKDQVETLKKKDAIYIVGSGRINVAGMTEEKMEPLCAALARVLNGK